jgi:hypothetical protein
LFVFEQRRHQMAEVSVVLDDQYGSTFLLRLPCAAQLRSEQRCSPRYVKYLRYGPKAREC